MTTTIRRQIPNKELLDAALREVDIPADQKLAHYYQPFYNPQAVAVEMCGADAYERSAGAAKQIIEKKQEEFGAMFGATRSSVPTIAVCLVALLLMEVPASTIISAIVAFLLLALLGALWEIWKQLVRSGEVQKMCMIEASRQAWTSSAAGGCQIQRLMEICERINLIERRVEQMQAFRSDLERHIRDEILLKFWGSHERGEQLYGRKIGQYLKQIAGTMGGQQISGEQIEQMKTWMKDQIVAAKPEISGSTRRKAFEFERQIELLDTLWGKIEDGSLALKSKL